MDAFHDPLPPGIQGSIELANEFEVFLAEHVQRMKGGYDCRPFTHLFIAWLIGREHMRAEYEAAMRGESERAVAMFNSFSKN